MKLHPIELSSEKKAQCLANGPKIAFLVTIALLFLTLIPLYYPLPGYASFQFSSSSSQKVSSPTHSSTDDGDSKVVTSDRECDIFTGEWVPNPKAPYYTNATCWAIHDHQNCMKYGRPDLGFMKWRWKPKACELPIFNPFQFLEILRGKSLAFVGDSISRNQMQSLICLLSRGSSATDPVVSKYIASGLSREAVPLAVANYGDNPTKVNEFVNAYNLLREMGFSSKNVAEALVMYDNDTDKALAHFLNSS